MIETLECKAGHQFTRTATRGKKPQWCPDHRPSAPKPSQRSTAPLRDLVRPETLSLLNTTGDPELRRKLEYVVKELRSKRDEADLRSLDKTQRELIREGTKR